MKFEAAYLLANLARNLNASKGTSARSSTRCAEVEEDKPQMLFKEVEGKDVAELLASGREGRTISCKIFAP